MSDFDFIYHGSMWLVVPRTPAAEDWLDEKVVNDDTTWWGHAMVVEPRYIEDLLEGIADAGLTVCS